MSIYLQSLLVVTGLFTLVFCLATYLKNNSIVDSFWGLGFIAVVITCLVNLVQNDPPGNYLPFYLIAALVTIWGLRLSLHIFTRNFKKGEDFRYAAWRKQWGKWLTIRSFFQIFILQALLCYVISLPIQYTAMHPESDRWHVMVYIGLLWWVFGFFFEAIGDWQLRQFVRNKKNKGKIMRYGLWKYSRHPNYFGEATMWWAIFLISLSTQPPLPLIISPLLIAFLLRFVSGVPLLEAKYSDNKEYQEYKRTTPAMLPRFM